MQGTQVQSLIREGFICSRETRLSATTIGATTVGSPCTAAGEGTPLTAAGEETPRTAAGEETPRTAAGEWTPPAAAGSNIEIRPINNPTIASKYSREKNSCTPLT